MKNSWEIYKELKHEFNKKKPKKIGRYEILMVILLAMFLFPIFQLQIMKKYERIDSFDSISEPIQTPTTWWVMMEVNGEKINIDFLAEYDIKGRVLATAQYWDNIFERMFNTAFRLDKTIRYKDVWIWWWFLTQDDYVKRFNRTSLSRFLLPEYKSYQDYLYIKSRFSWEDINSHMSHNHLIPADNRIQTLLRWIKKWQYIHIKWYLVRLHWDNGYNLVSSLTRDDMWDWACETIYVTDITRLKEK